MHGVKEDTQGTLFDQILIELGEDMIDKAVEGGFEIGNESRFLAFCKGKRGNRRMELLADELLQTLGGFHGRVSSFLNDELDAVIRGGVMTCRDFNAVVELLILNEEHDQRRGRASLDENDVKIHSGHGFRDPAGRAFRKEAAVVADDDRLIGLLLLLSETADAARDAQDVGFVVLDRLMAECEAAGVKAFRAMQRLASAAPPMIRDANIGDDFFFKGAPAAILTISKSTVDAALASSYMELMAESLGLGVFYSGFFVAASKYVPAVKKLLDLPDGQDVVTCLVIGHSDVKYRRTVPRRLSSLLLR